MTPIWLRWLASLPAASSNSVSGSDSMVGQWRNPGDILSILLLLGPDVVQRAIAQLAGRSVTPVAFSFGWVAYAISALLSSFGGAASLLSPCSEPCPSLLKLCVNRWTTHARV
jgi:hypothetical protein